MNNDRTPERAQVQRQEREQQANEKSNYYRLWIVHHSEKRSRQNDGQGIAAWQQGLKNKAAVNELL